ncbi:hypothetical protein DWC19_35075 [Streptomyces sp. M7]|nr:hypothetical protein DWC19_35075 [Streptomyces sp. M7]
MRVTTAQSERAGKREGKVRLGGALDAALVGVVLSSLLSGCYSLAAAIQDPRLPPGTPQAVPDGLLVGTWRNGAGGGSSSFAADGSFTAPDIRGQFLDWAGDGPGNADDLVRSAPGLWETMTWTLSGESEPRTEVTIRFADADVSAECEAGGTSASPGSGRT